MQVERLEARSQHRARCRPRGVQGSASRRVWQVLVCWLAAHAWVWGMESPRGAVATVHAAATQAALEAFGAGGNAIDAAVAAALMLGVVDGHNSGIGGGCFALVRLAKGRLLAIDGRESAPGAATRDMFLRNGRAVPEWSQTGPLAVGVPGELAALEHLARRWGRLPLARALRAAADVAEQGFEVTPSYAARLRGEVETLRSFSATAAIFLRPGGSPWEAGDRLRQPDLARTYRAIAVQGTDWFYRGPFARELEAWMTANGGLITRRDLRRYRVVVRDPVVTTYRGFTVAGFPPPSSGGVHVAQVLNILERFDVARWGPGSPDLAHVLAEALKLAFADRAHWLGDPAFARVPRGLVAKDYAAELAGRIRLDRAGRVDTHGMPPEAGRDVFQKHTTHLSVADGEGNWVALTATVNTTFGSKVVVPGTGVVLNNQMDDFAAHAGGTNYFGLPGADANAVAPGKRPLSSMSPTLVLRDGEPMFAVGAAGGPTIISQALGALVNVMDFGMTAEEAIRAPRIHHQWRPDEVVLEEGWSDEVARGLAAKGHVVRPVKSLGAAQAVAAGPEGLTGAADPRVGGRAEALR